MLSLAGYLFYLYTHHTDMRMGINGLSGIVRNMMDQDPLNRGVIYLFFIADARSSKCWSLKVMGMHFITKGWLRAHLGHLYMIRLPDQLLWTRRM